MGWGTGAGGEPLAPSASSSTGLASAVADSDAAFASSVAAAAMMPADPNDPRARPGGARGGGEMGLGRPGLGATLPVATSADVDKALAGVGIGYGGGSNGDATAGPS